MIIKPLKITINKIKFHILYIKDIIIIIMMTISMKTNFFSRTLRAHLPLDINFRGCMKGFQFQKKDFNLLEQAETLGVGYGCPEDSLVSTSQSKAFC